MKGQVPLVFSICEEFSNTVLIDSNRKSILVNVQKEYFSHIYRELKKRGYILVFKTALKSTASVTCTFILGNK